MIWLATVMMSFPFFHSITNPSSLSTMHGNLKDKDDNNVSGWWCSWRGWGWCLRPDVIALINKNVLLLRDKLGVLQHCLLHWHALASAKEKLRQAFKKKLQKYESSQPALSWSFLFLLVVVVAVLLITFCCRWSCNQNIYCNKIQSLLLLCLDVHEWNFLRVLCKCENTQLETR